MRILILSVLCASCLCADDAARPLADARGQVAGPTVVAYDLPAAGGMPSYTADSIVSAATGSGPLASGTLVTIYGINLSYDTAAVTPDTIHSNNLPTELAGTRVFVNNVLAGLYYVSPKQINFLIGPTVLPGSVVEVQVSTEGRSGPSVRLQLADAAPGLFLSDPEFAVGTRADGSVVTRDSPVHPGEVVVLYATGLGATRPAFGERELPDRAAVLVRQREFRVELNGDSLPADAVFYAGVTPGFAGLYQVNLRLPATLAGNPEIRIGFDGQMSPAGIKLAVTPEAAPR